MSEDEKRAWDRLAGESSKAYHHFCIYRDMGASRSLRQMAGIPGCTSVRRQLNRWSSRWRWVERCQQYDDYLEYQLRVLQEKERREMSKRHAKIAMLGQNILVKGMEELLAKVQNGQHNLAPAELARLMDVSVKVGESGPEDFVELSRAVLVRRAARLRRVVEKVVGEELFEHRKIPTALHFLSVAPDHCFRGFAQIAAGHDLPPMGLRSGG